MVARAAQLVEPQVVLQEQPEVELEAERGAAPKVLPRVTPRVELEKVTLVRAVMAAKARVEGEGEGELSAVSKPDSCANGRRCDGFVV